MKHVDEVCRVTGLTRLQLGDALGVAQRTVYAWKNVLPDGAYFQLYALHKLGLLPDGVTVPEPAKEGVEVDMRDIYKLYGMKLAGVLPEKVEKLLGMK